jgi:UDP-4-amino-4,6-dideoxy-N-acetyl-beta-L-altrosamine transaminase
MIPYGRQQITQADIDAVVEVLRSDFLTQGPAVPRFEDAMRARVGAKHAIAVSSATSALHVACAALGLSEGDLLWTVPNTFVASANCGRYCGADIDFVDIDPRTWNLSVPALREKLERAAAGGRLPKVVVPVHFAGQPTEQEEIWKLAQQYGFKVLEDASHAVGAKRRNEPVGSCRWSDITVFSFHPVKIITTAEGGIAFTNDDELARRMSMLRTHGITRESARFAQPPGGAWYYEQQLLGYNYRMTDVQAALGYSQSARIDDFVECRNKLARTYDEAFRGLALQLPAIQAENRCAFHLYVVRIPGDGSRRRQIFDAMRQKGIGVNVHYIPVHLQPYYRALGFAPGYCPEAEAHGNQAITLPLYPGLSEQDQRKVISALRAEL